MVRITSPANPRIMQVRELQTTKGRKKSGLSFMEGPHLFEVLLASGLLPEEIYFQPELLERTPEGRSLLARLLHPDELLARVPRLEVSERVSEALSDAQTSQGVLCVISLAQFAPAQLEKRRVRMTRPALLILDDLADPGNLGTILRTALAADVEAVLLTPHCADSYSPKVLRAAAGAHVALPVWPDLSWSEIAQRVEQHCKRERVLVAEAGSQFPYHAENLAQPFALIIGNEAHGPSPQARQFAAHTISIPLANDVESLNAAMATGIILFEAVRQLSLA
jgi:TrmH family RNA methyltransferase